MATVTSKGQITLPKAVRQALGADAGAEVEFVIQPEGVLLRRRIPDAAFDEWQGYLPAHGDGSTTDDIMAELRNV